MGTPEDDNYLIDPSELIVPDERKFSEGYKASYVFGIVNDLTDEQKRMASEIFERLKKDLSAREIVVEIAGYLEARRAFYRHKGRRSSEHASEWVLAIADLIETGISQRQAIRRARASMLSVLDGSKIDDKSFSHLAGRPWHTNRRRKGRTDKGKLDTRPADSTIRNQLRTLRSSEGAELPTRF